MCTAWIAPASQRHQVIVQRHNADVAVDGEAAAGVVEQIEAGRCGCGCSGVASRLARRERQRDAVERGASSSAGGVCCSVDLDRVERSAKGSSGGIMSATLALYR